LAKKWKPEKHFIIGARKWFEELSPETKQLFLQRYDKLRTRNFEARNPYPDMRDLKATKFKEFSDKDIYCFYRFKDHYIK
jgi:hypothetical protein